MSEPKRIIDFPDEWATSGEPVKHFAGSRGNMHIFGVLFSDEVSMWGLIYPGGHRFVRCCEATNWAIEERYGGRPPRPRDLAAVNEQWRGLVDTMVEANRLFDGA